MAPYSAVTFTKDDFSKNLPNNMSLSIQVDGKQQNLDIHTSCSQPLAIGDVYGSMVLVEMDADTGVAIATPVSASISTSTILP